MAKRGKVYLFGNSELSANPIHGEDLADLCVSAIDMPDKDIEVGGPEILTQNEIASIAFDVLGEQPKIVHIPDWVRIIILKLVRILTGSKFYGPVEFFMTVMAIDMLAPVYGKHTLKDYFKQLNNQTV